MQFNSKEIRKILCIKPRGIGDIVLSTIILDSIVNYFPSAKIDYLTETFAAPSVQNNPMVNKVLTMEKTELPLWVALRIRKEKYDMVLDLWSNPRSAQITFLSGVKYRVGYGYRGRKYAYNIRATSEKGTGHSAEHNLEILKPIGVPVISKKVYYYVNDGDNQFGKEFREKNFNENDTVIGIIPAGGWPSKRCDAVKWVEICKAINERYNTLPSLLLTNLPDGSQGRWSGVKFLILWGPGDEEDSNYIKEHLPDIAVLAPETKLQTMAGMINNCDIIIANDSGPMHISAALGKPTLGIFGPTNPKNHGPYSPVSDYVIKEDLFCIICNKLECPFHHECMLELPVEKVLEILENIGKGILSVP